MEEVADIVAWEEGDIVLLEDEEDLGAVGGLTGFFTCQPRLIRLWNQVLV